MPVQAEMFQQEAKPLPRGSWSPPTDFPDLGGCDDLFIDLETDGLDIWGDSKAVGLGVRRADTREGWYFPWGHKGGGNLDKEMVLRWAKRELRDKHLTNLNIKFENHMLRKDGVDLEAMGCTLHEVQHLAALTDEKQRGFSLDALMRKRLNHGKEELPVASSKIADLPSSLVGPYNLGDTLGALELRESYEPEIKSQALERVLALEDSLLFPVSHMERQGVIVDVPKLDRWIKETEDEFGRRIIDIWRQTGVRVKPKGPGMAQLYDRLGLEYGLTENGNPSFTKSALAANDHPLVQEAFGARQIYDLRNNFLVKYRKAVNRDGLLRYSIHQLRNDEYGTITGRFAMSSMNLQQVHKPAKQPNSTLEWIIRELFVPANGMRWLSADASQIEFRLFAHFAALVGMGRLATRYKADPKVDFHNMVMEFIRAYIPDFKRDYTKNINFEKMYGGGVDKLMFMINSYAQSEVERIDRDRAQEINDQYDRAFPEAKKLLGRLSRLAESRGYVKTMYGRRRRYVVGDRFYSALNSILQGSAADILKKKIVEVYSECKTYFNLRFTVHDEFDGDVAGDGDAKRVETTLNEQTTPTKVFISWDVKTAPNWRCGWKPKEAK